MKTLSRNNTSGVCETALRMSGISKRFGPVQALSDVSFAVQPGTVHALVGENGAGKSTLMKILAGVHHPGSGSIEIDGRLQQFTAPADALAAGVSMIYQELDLAEHLTVAANVFLGSEPPGRLAFTIDHAKTQAQTSELANRFGFEVNPAAIVQELSTGDCQIVEILKALRRNASIIVMDEPTSSLSENESAKLFEVVRTLRRRGIAIVYISHRLEEITDLADDITVLRDGRVVYSGPIDDVDIGGIVRYMVGRELKDLFPTRDAQTGEICFSVKNLSCGNYVKDISFDVRKGEIVGMAGLVGAGRTEVARAIFGVDKKTSGTFFLNDRQLAIASPSDAIANNIAYLTEDRKRTGLCLDLSCCCNITLPNLTVIGMKNIIRPARENRIADEIASRISVKWSSPQSPAASLSGGNQQKLLVARWLLADSKFMIFDEPTRGIDIGSKKEVYRLLNTLAARGKAILFISSELDELFGISDRILVMRRGRLVASLKTKDTTPEQVMHLAAVEEK